MIRTARLGRAGRATAIALLAALSGAPSPSLAQSTVRYVDLVFERVERTSDVRYGGATDKPTGRPVDLLLDLYEPAGDTEAKRPVFVFLFGGGFVAGNKEQEPRQYCELMARRGYVAVAISYRINQGNIAVDGIPAAVSDTRQAMAWLGSHAAEHRLDTGRIVLGGSSAGAIASLFTAYTDVERGVAGEAPAALVMDLWGGLYNRVSDMQAGEPPLIIIHGTADNVVPYAEATKLRDRAELVDIPYAFHPLQGKGHAPYMPAELMVLVARFAYDRLWVQAPSPSATPEPTTAPTDSPEPTTAPTDPPTASPSPVAPTRAPTPLPTAAPRSTIYLPLAASDAVGG